MRDGEPVAAAPAWWDRLTWVDYLREHSFEVSLVYPRVLGDEGPRVEAWVNALPSLAPTKGDGYGYLVLVAAVERAGRDEEFELALRSACALGGRPAVHALLKDLYRAGRLRGRP